MLFFEMVDKHAPLVTIRARRDKADWIDKDLLLLMRSCNYYRGEYQKTGLEEYWNRYKELRAEVNHRMRQAKANHFSAVCQDLKVQPSQTCKQLNSLLGQMNSRPVNSLRSGDAVLTKKVDVVNKLVSHFSNIPFKYSCFTSMQTSPSPNHLQVFKHNSGSSSQEAQQNPLSSMEVF